MILLPPGFKAHQIPSNVTTLFLYFVSRWLKWANEFFIPGGFYRFRFNRFRFSSFRLSCILFLAHPFPCTPFSSHTLFLAHLFPHTSFSLSNVHSCPCTSLFLHILDLVRPFYFTSFSLAHLYPSRQGPSGSFCFLRLDQGNPSITSTLALRLRGGWGIAFNKNARDTQFLFFQTG